MSEFVCVTTQRLVEFSSTFWSGPFSGVLEHHTRSPFTNLLAFRYGFVSPAIKPFLETNDTSVTPELQGDVVKLWRH